MNSICLFYSIGRTNYVRHCVLAVHRLSIRTIDPTIVASLFVGRSWTTSFVPFSFSDSTSIPFRRWSIRCCWSALATNDHFEFSLAFRLTIRNTSRRRPHSPTPGNRWDLRSHLLTIDRHDSPSEWILCALSPMRSIVMVDIVSYRWSVLASCRRPDSQRAVELSVCWILFAIENIN